VTVAAPLGVVTVDEHEARSFAWLRRLIVPALVIAAILAVGYAWGHDVPTWLDAHVRSKGDEVYKWTQLHNNTNWLFVDVFEPIGDFIAWATRQTLWLLVNLRWPGVLALVGVVGYMTGGVKAAITGVFVLAGCGVLGYWADTMITLSLMLVAVIISLLIGIPLGIWAGLSERANRAMRGVLDTAQVMPIYVYMLPLVVAFGVGAPAGVIATVIFAVPPAVRITALGIRGVPHTTVEVGQSFGCTGRQLLYKVRLPLAKRPILLGINQVIMMAFGVVVFAALIGTGGTGNKVLGALQTINVGKAFAAGLAIVFAAIALDRITTGERSSKHKSSRMAQLHEHPWLMVAIGGGIVLVVAVLAKVLGADNFPDSWTYDVSKPVNDAADWVNENFRHGVPIVGGTASFSDFVVINFLTPARDLLQNAAWYVVVAIVVAIGWASGGWKLGALCGGCFVGIAALQVWDLAMDTMSQVLVAVVFSVIIAIPMGIWAARSPTVERILRPLLDAAQVMPAFVYLVPVIFLFNVGRVPGVIAAVVYAVPPGIRLTTLGLREVPYAPREAAISFGATPRQELLKVQLPLALRSIMLGINQVIIMVLAIVVVAALIGAGALGLETIYGLTKHEIGRGVAAGLAIVLLAVVLDRVTQAWGERARRGARLTKATV
jgi:glycine betaine/proline transport system permease protein